MIEGGASDVVRETTPLHLAGDLGYGVGSYIVAIRHHGRELVRGTSKHVLVHRRSTDTAGRAGFVH